MFRFFRRFFNLFRRFRRRSVPVLEPGSQTDLNAELNAEPNADYQAGSKASSRGISEIDPLDDRPADRAIPEEKEMPTTPPNDPNQPSRVQMLSQVINVLRAYLQTFGRPELEVDFRAVVGAIAANLSSVQIENKRMEGFIDEAIAAYSSVDNDRSIVDTTTQLLAEQVAVWLREQEVTIENVVSAYLQQFAPDDAEWTTGELLGLVQTVVATLNDGSLSRSGGRSLVAKVIDTFNLDKALSRRIAPEWIALAQKVASYVRTGSLQSEVRSIAWAYLKQFQAILSPQLIEQIMEEGPLNLSPAEVLSGDLGEFSEMLYYKFQLLEADPVVTKTHEDIAVQVRAAVEDFKRRRDGDVVDITKGEQIGELEVGSPFVRS